MIDAEVQVHLKQFDELRGSLRIEILKAVNRAAKPLKEAVTANARSHQRFGYLAESIGGNTRFYTGSKSLIYVVGPKMSFVRTKGKYRRGKHTGEARRYRPYLYAWLVERGSKRSRKMAFLQPAFDSYGHTFGSRLSDEVRAAVEKTLKG